MSSDDASRASAAGGNGIERFAAMMQAQFGGCALAVAERQMALSDEPDGIWYQITAALRSLTPTG